MKTKISLNKNRHGNEYISLPLFDKELFLFSEKHNIISLPGVKLPKIEISKTIRGHICLSRINSRLNSTDPFEYSKIGEWTKTDKNIFLHIEGKGTLKLNLIFDEEINVIENNDNATRHRWAINVYDNYKELPFNPDNF